MTNKGEIVSETCNWLCKYIFETRKVDRTEYIPLSLYLLLAGLKKKH